MKQYIFLWFFVSLFVSAIVHAQPTIDDLKRIEIQLRKERQSQLESKRQASKLAGEIKTVQKQVIRSAKAVQEKEEILDQLQKKLKEMQQEEKDLSGRLVLTDAQIVCFVTALQTLALRPPEIMLMEPLSPVHSLRGQLILNKTLPVSQHVKDSVLLDLSRLSKAKIGIQEQAARIENAMKQLNNKTNQMNSLIRQKTELQAQYDASHQESQRRIVSLANQAEDIKDLLARLELEKKHQKVIKQQEIQYSQPVSSSLLPLGLSKTSFKKAKGNLPYPVRGKIIEKYGDEMASGLHAKGITIAVRPLSTVLLPFKGTVLFSGPFKNYGQLLIIDNGNNYLTLLAGMEKVDVFTGQGLLSGEPVGRMGGDNPKLYIEIRKDGQPLDPKPWFDSKTNAEAG